MQCFLKLHKKKLDRLIASVYDFILHLFRKSRSTERFQKNDFYQYRLGRLLPDVNFSHKNDV